jgi:DNA (cytosine-5)-methyltransferase 1
VLTLGSLFSGIGGLELGVEAATGARVLWQVERDAWCREVLAKHWPDAVRYDDVCTVNGLPRVDIICGGFPCQDVSVAGKRAGFSGERSSLWREYRRIVADVRPRFVFVENVSGLFTADGGWAFGEVLGDLAALGFNAEWDVFRASDVGAPHRRERVFLLAYRDGERRELQRVGNLLDGEREALGHDADGCGGADAGSVGNAESGARQRASSWDRGHAAFASEAGLADASRVGEREPADEGVAVAARGRARVEPRRGGESPVGDADGQRRAELNRAAVAERAELRGAGGAVGSDGRGGSLARVGLPADGLPRRLDGHRWPAGRGEAQHPGEPPRTASGVAMRAAQLKALGNAVVPQCAALAWRVLSARVRSEAA